MVAQVQLRQLADKLDGELLYDTTIRIMYATDASIYQQIPLAVCYPKHKEDIQKVVKFCNKHKIGIIPRTAGTSLAGQCVGKGIVLDVSKYLNKIIQLDVASRTVRVQPGVVRDELNLFLKPFGLFFGPNTSTSNRCMIGGMVGNNSSGTTSIQYGVTRDKIVSIESILSDGSLVHFGDTTKDQFLYKRNQQTLEGNIYRTLEKELSSAKVQKQIEKHFPKSSIHRRNTGYAIDIFAKNKLFCKDNQEEFNIAKLLTGSEGTLAISTEIIISLDPLPPEKSLIVATHFHSIKDCMESIYNLMQHNLYTCEMMDKTILDCTKNNTGQRENRFFIQDDPKAILLLELRAENTEGLIEQLNKLLKTVQEKTKAYAYPILYQEDIQKAFELRKAGLGLLGGIVGDKKAVACIEDTAVALEDLADYISDFTQLMKEFKQESVYYAHAGAGEIHLRPILNLKKSKDVILLKEITDKVALLVKKYKGSMSGEHGDGIVRSSYIPMLIGEENYNILKNIKNSFDPKNIYNPGKIINPLPINQNLRYKTNREEPKIKAFMNYNDTKGMLRALEQCNGSGDCRKSEKHQGVMCPSYQATKNEIDVTRGRANALRHFLTENPDFNNLDQKFISSVLDLCLSCKACAKECPSNIDMARYKMEFLHQNNLLNGIAWKDKLIYSQYDIHQKADTDWKRNILNKIYQNNITSHVIKKAMGIAQARPLPLLSKISFKNWLKENLSKLQPKNPKSSLYIFVDEFTDQHDLKLGIESIKLLTALNYEVKYIKHQQSGRVALSKGLLEQAKEIAQEQLKTFGKVISEKSPLVGIEPSAILSFRDEYLHFFHQDKSREDIEKLAKNTLLIDEFIYKEFKNNNISSEDFNSNKENIILHGHCHQKALSNINASVEILNIPQNYKASLINSGCCGMAGAFGYDKKHYNVSLKIANQRLIPNLNEAKTRQPNTLICATGTSCRHQIEDLANHKAMHPISILWKASKKHI